MKLLLRNKKIVLVFVLGLILIYPVYYSDIPVEVLKKEYANKASKFITIQGMDVHYRDEGQGEPIVLVHGTASSLHTWDEWTAQLSKEYRVIRMDLPAFGLTGPNSTGNYTIESYTRFLKTFLDTLGLQKVHLAGNSLGGNIAWNVAADYPEMVDKLILIDASGLPTFKEQPWIFKMAKTPILNSLFLYITPKFIIQNNMEQVYADDSKITDQLITRYHNMALRKGNRQAFIDRAKIDFKPTNKAVSDKMKRVMATTLLLWGAKDTWIPLSNGERMNKIIPNSTLVVLKNSGHVPMEEQPIESLKILYDFLATDSNIIKKT